MVVRVQLWFSRRTWVSDFRGYHRHLGNLSLASTGTQRALQTWQAFQKEIAYLFPDAKYKVREVSLLRTAWLKIVDFDAHHSKDVVARNLQNTYATLSGPIERVSDGTDFMHSRDLWASIYGGCSSYSMPGYGDAGAITRRYDAPSPVLIDHQTPMLASSSTRAYYQSELRIRRYVKGCHTVGYHPQYINIGGFREIDDEQIFNFLNVLDPGRQISPPDQGVPLQGRLPVTPVQHRLGRARRSERHHGPRSRSGPEFYRRPAPGDDTDGRMAATPVSGLSRRAKKLLVAGVVTVALTGVLVVTVRSEEKTSGEPVPQRIPRLPKDY